MVRQTNKIWNVKVDDEDFAFSTDTAKDIQITRSTGNVQINW